MAVLALVEAENCLVHVVVCHVTGSQGASSVRLISQKACIVTGLPTSQSVLEDFNTGILASSRVHENWSKGKQLAHLDLWGQKVTVLVLVVAEDGLVHVVVADVTSSQGAGSVNLQATYFIIDTLQAS